MSSSVWPGFWIWLTTACLTLIVIGHPIPANSRAWITGGQSGYSSSYHTQSWQDTLFISTSDVLGGNWSVGQHLDLLRKELSSGNDLQQRNHRVYLAAEPRMRTWGWTLNIDGEDNAIIESVDRRTLRSRVLAGGMWRRGRTASIGAQIGGIASRHRAAHELADDQGFAQRLAAQWNFDRERNDKSRRVNARASLTHEGDQRQDLPSHETNWVWDMMWSEASDSLALGWEEQWRDTRFYPSPDQFDRIGRQNHRYRIARIEWAHAATPDGIRWLPFLTPNLSWHAQIGAGLDRNTYSLAQGNDASAALPGDVDTRHRSYAMGASRHLGNIRIEADYRYRWTEDNFGESRRDQTAETGELDAKLRWKLSDADSAGVQSVFRVTSYAVPGGASFFTDRDQAERVVEMFYWHRFNPVLTVRPVFSYRGFRQVFISEELSANNNTDNIYLLAPAIEWQPIQAMAVAQRFAIRAHYRFFDYERTDPSGRGTLYRKAESVTRTRISGTASATWVIQYTYRYEDFGGLYDRDGWVQSVDWDRRSHLVDAHVIWRPLYGLSVRPALGLEHKKSFNHRRVGEAILRIEDEPFRRTNVSMTVEWSTRAGYMIHGAIARRAQQFGDGPRDRDDRWELAITKGF